MTQEMTVPEAKIAEYRAKAVEIMKKLTAERHPPRRVPMDEGVFVMRVLEEQFSVLYEQERKADQAKIEQLEAETLREKW